MIGAGMMGVLMMGAVMMGAEMMGLTTGMDRPWLMMLELRETPPPGITTEPVG